MAGKGGGQQAGWLFHFGDAKKATAFPGSPASVDVVAKHAAQYDFMQNGGWSRTPGIPFAVYVVSPDGSTTAFDAWPWPVIDFTIAPRA